MLSFTHSEISRAIHPSLQGHSTLLEIDTADFAALLNRAFSHKHFTADWFSTKALPLYSHLRGENISRILEIGVFEGRSALFFAELFPDAHLTLVDVFAGPHELNFDFNLQDQAERIKKIKKTSHAALSLDLYDERFDFIYIDGDHGAGGVLIDAILSWRLLEPGGIILFDDYDWIREELHHATRRGINTFLDLIAGSFEVLFADRQVLLRKTGELHLLQTGAPQ